MPSVPTIAPMMSRIAALSTTGIREKLYAQQTSAKTRRLTNAATMAPTRLLRYANRTFLFNDVALPFLRHDEVRKTGGFQFLSKTVHIYGQRILIYEAVIIPELLHQGIT